MNSYEVAVKMFIGEHDRRNRWALFFFGTIAGVFVLWDQTGKAIPLWAPSLVGLLGSCIWLLTAQSIRASSWAWGQVVRDIESLDPGLRETAQPFRMFEEKLLAFDRWQDLAVTLSLWKLEPYIRVTRLLTLYAILAVFFFLILTVFSLTRPTATHGTASSQVVTTSRMP